MSRISSGCYEDAAVRAGDLVQLVRIADGFASRTSFLTELTLDPPQATSDLAGAPLQDDDYLVLSTIHSAKGQEWRSVFVLNCVDGCIPSDLATGTPEEIEEERRLLYVAMTRAKDALHLMVPVRFYTQGQAARGDKHVHATRTRFLPRHVARQVRGAVLEAERQRGRLVGAAGAPAGPQAPDDEHVGIDGRGGRSWLRPADESSPAGRVARRSGVAARIAEGPPLRPASGCQIAPDIAGCSTPLIDGVPWWVWCPRGITGSDAR